MATVKNIDIGLICIGDIIAIPTGLITNNGIATVSNVKVVVDVPTGLDYESSILPIGNYNSGTDTWENITILPGASVEGEIKFLVTDDTSPIFKITFTATTDVSCESCDTDNSICVITSGITCTELRKCDPLLAMPDEFTFLKNSTNNAINVSTNDQPCPGALSRTFEWLDIANIHGTMTGLPNAATYSPDTDYVGTVLARYGMYCNDVLVDDEVIRINVTDEDFNAVDEVPTDYSTSVFGTKCDGTRGSVKPVVTKDVVTYLNRSTNLSITLDSPKIIHIEPTDDIFVTITKGVPFCSTNDIDIKHIGTGDNRVFKIRVLNASGDTTVDGDTYFEMDNAGSGTNNLRGYNFTAYNFYYNATGELFVK